ncbi:glycosyl transferase [Aerophototrophica crusticola]|uniref:Glycosyl transferase n=1 Tax=Aerophototrophica crusticola TaxID=1709002 RepID=A0A858R7Z0_9PROT|nr:glycosyl transferase [Rhodospirillaceae bacterium B3]
MTASRRFILVSGGDANYFPLMRELLASIRRFKTVDECPVGILDVGLKPEQRAELEAAGCRLVTPGWEYDLSPLRTMGQDHVRAEIAKLFLDRHFPGYGSIVWIDADAWIQDWAAIDLFLRAAEKGKFASVAQTGRFRPTEVTVKWLFRDVVRVRSILYKAAAKARLPQAIRQSLALRPTLNGGAFALRTDAPHWDAFRRWHAQVVRHCRLFSSVQLAMALGIFVDEMPVELLPEWCNYLGPWRYDAQRDCLVEYYLPNRPVGVVHMAGADAMRRDPTVTTPILDLDDRPHDLSLRYPHWERRAAVVRKVEELEMV